MLSLKSHPGILRLLPLFSLSLMWAGCGQSANESTAATRPLTKAQFVEKANAICKKGTVKKEKLLKAAAEKSGKSLLELSQGEVEDLAAEVVLPLYGKMASELGALGPPGGSKETARRIVAEFESALERVESNPSLLFKQPFERANTGAHHYGLVSCSFY